MAADGRTGKLVVREALARGHAVVAGVYGANPFAPHDNLRVAPCDGRKLADVRQLVRGCDAVVSVIGHVKGSPADIQTVTIANTIAAMDELNIRRFVSLTGTGVRLPGDKITLIDRILNLAVSLIDPARVKDGVAHVKLLQQSDLDWTVIRVLKLQNVRAQGFTLREHGATKNYVSRADAAKAIVDVLDGKSFVRAAPILSQ